VRRLAQILLCVPGVVVLDRISHGGRLDQGWETIALALAWIAVTLDVWFAAERGMFGAVLARRRIRRMAYRAGVLLVAAGIAVFPTALLRDCLLGAGVLLPLGEAVVWRAMPAGLREDYRKARIAVAATGAEGRTQSWRLDGFDESQGAVGRPRPVADFPPMPRTDPLVIRPSRRTASGVDRDRAKRFATWWRYARLDWDGSRLCVVDPHLQTIPLPLHPKDGDPTHVAEVVWSSHPGIDEDEIYFLDADGHQYARMPTFGFTPADIAEVVTAAGLPLRYYRVEHGGVGHKSLDQLLFPERPDTFVITLR
jgi:hypothetical protein